MAEPRTRFGRWLRGRGQRTPTILGAPGQRVTEPSYSSAFTTLNKYASTVKRDFVKDVYPLLWRLHLAIPDINRAATNNVNLANTGHKVYVVARDEAYGVKVKAELDFLAVNCWHLPGGADAFVQHSLLQQTITGAISCEPVMKADLSGLDYFAPVAVETIEFKVNPYGRPIPCQRQTGKVEPVELDPDVFIYFPLTTVSDRPYAIPPFISSLTAVERQLKLDEQLQALLEVLCLWGVIAFPLQPPTRERGETLDTYNNRVKTYYGEQLTALVEGMKNGVIGYPPIPGVPGGPTVQSTTNSAQGIDKVTNFVDHRLSSGVGQDLSLLGRTVSVSETHIRYHYYIQRNCLIPMQAHVKRALERGYRLHLAVKGMTDVNISISFKAPKDMTALEDANTEEVRRRNVNSDWINGLISKQQAAEQLGYDKPADDEKPWAERQSEFAWSGAFEFDQENNSYRFVRPSLPPISFAAASNEALNERALKLIGAISPFLDDAGSKAADAATRFLEGSITAGTFAEQAVLAIGETYHERFTQEDAYTAMIDGTEQAFSYFRLMDSVLPGARKPVSWTDVDSRVSRALADRPAYYMTKLAQTEAAQNQVRDYLEKEFLDRGLSAADAKAVDLFRADLRDKLGEMSQGRAENIIRTGMSRIRSDAHTRQFHTDGIKKARFTAVMDGVTSAICRRRHGTIIDIGREHQRLLEDLEMKPDEYKKARDWGPLSDPNISEEELQRRGIAAPPCHGNCRSKLVAIVN